MTSITAMAHAACQPFLAAGSIAVDATAGNGHDTLWLAQQVGPASEVFAIDLQQAALDATASRLASVNVSNVTLILGDHANLQQLLPQRIHGRVAVVMFNLGYLPGGDHARCTRKETTVRALAAALKILQPGGVLSVVAYPGHPGGWEETEAVREFLLTSGGCGEMLRGPIEIAGGEKSPQHFLWRKHTGAGE